MIAPRIKRTTVEGWMCWDGTREDVMAQAKRLGLTVDHERGEDCWVDFRDGWSFACATQRREGQSGYRVDGPWRLAVHPATIHIHNAILADRRDQR